MLTMLNCPLVDGGPAGRGSPNGHPTGNDRGACPLLGPQSFHVCVFVLLFVFLVKEEKRAAMIARMDARHAEREANK